MKKTTSPRRARRTAPDEILPEYDFSHAARNPYASRVAEGATFVTIDPDVATIFPTSADVNNALRALASIIREHSTVERRKRKRG